MALIAERTALDSALQFYSVVLANNAVSSQETPAGVCVNSLSTCGESLKLAKWFRKNDEGAVITSLHPAKVHNQLLCLFQQSGRGRWLDTLKPCTAGKWLL